MNHEEANKLYDSSVKILKENQHKNGGFYASPPGTRYPYVYARDHSIDIMGASSAGLFDQARLGLEFMFKNQLKTGEFAQRYDVSGENKSYKELQIDGNGLVLFALGDYIRKTDDMSLLDDYWDNITKATEFIFSHMNDDINLIHTINSIHEYPAFEHGFEIYANSACCGGLLEVCELGKKIKSDVKVTKKKTKKLQKAICTSLWSPMRRSFIKNIRIQHQCSNPLGCDPYSSVVTDVDAALYAPAYFNVISDHDLKVRLTCERIYKELWDQELEGLNRYPESWGRNNGGYGPWCHFTTMLAKHYIKTGRKWRANKYLSWVVNSAYNYQLPEHVSTPERYRLWKEEYTTAHIMRDDKKIMMEKIESHPLFKEGIVHVVEPLIWPHAEYIMAYNEYCAAFGDGEHIIGEAEVE